VLGTARRWKPYPELLTAAGISWKVFGTPDAHLGDNVLRYFPQYRPVGGDPTLSANAFGSNAFPADFAADALAGRLPQVSWVLGSLVDTEHAPAPVEWGQDDAQKIVLALLNSPQWPSTALFITYDENGGFFDHVPPPVPAGPAKAPGEFLNVAKLGPAAQTEGAGFLHQPVGLGFRVPALVISPFSRNPNPAGGPMVCSDALDHTSLLRFVEAVYKVRVPRRKRLHAYTRPEPLARIDHGRYDQLLQLRRRAEHFGTHAPDHQPRRPARAQRVPGADGHPDQRQLLVGLPGARHCKHAGPGAITRPSTAAQRPGRPVPAGGHAGAQRADGTVGAARARRTGIRRRGVLVSPRRAAEVLTVGSG
jgi:hypothetical protein